MKTIGSFAAKTHLAQILDEVAQGESYLITKRRKPVASITPVKTYQIPSNYDLIMGFRSKHGKSIKNFTMKKSWN